VQQGAPQTPRAAPRRQIRRQRTSAAPDRRPSERRRSSSRSIPRCRARSRNSDSAARELVCACPSTLACVWSSRGARLRAAPGGVSSAQSRARANTLTARSGRRAPAASRGPWAHILARWPHRLAATSTTSRGKATRTRSAAADRRPSPPATSESSESDELVPAGDGARAARAAIDGGLKKRGNRGKNFHAWKTFWPGKHS